MLIYLLQGLTLGASAAVMPGPFQAFILSRALHTGWRRTLPAALAPVMTDGPIILLTVFVLARVPALFLTLVRIAGGLFILYVAFGAFSLLKERNRIVQLPTHSGRRTLLDAVLLNFLNPNPYIFWGVVGAPIILLGWRKSPLNGLGFLFAFYAAFTLSLGVLIYLFAKTGTIRPGLNKTLRALAALALLGFGIYQIIKGASTLVGGG